MAVDLCTLCGILTNAQTIVEMLGTRSHAAMAKIMQEIAQDPERKRQFCEAVVNLEGHLRSANARWELEGPLR